MKPFLALSTITLLACAVAFADEHQSQGHRAEIRPDAPKCADYPCPNTPTGEDPQAIAVREGQGILEDLAKTDSDRKRWQRTIYSSETAKSLLELDIVKAAGFKMQLLPLKGHLQFVHKGGTDTFQIELPIDSKRAFCPEYTISVLDATPDHAVIRKLCIAYQYKPGRYFSGATYFLYDIATHTMRSFFRSSTPGKDDPIPAPESNPTITSLKDGYKVNWKASFPDNGQQTKFSINNRYMRTSAYSKGKLELVCLDLDVPKAEQFEGDMCEGTAPPLVSSSKR